MASTTTSAPLRAGTPKGPAAAPDRKVTTPMRNFGSSAARVPGPGPASRTAAATAARMEVGRRRLERAFIGRSSGVRVRRGKGCGDRKIEQRRDPGNPAPPCRFAPLWVPQPYLELRALEAPLPDSSTTTTPPPLVTRRDEGGVTYLTLNRGERFNPLSLEMIHALEGALDGVAADASVRVVVLAAAGKGFCAGHDLKEMRAHSDDRTWQTRLFEDCGRMMMRLTEIPQPVIARVHGIATAAGCQLVSMCDLAVAAEDARFALPGVNIGVFCSTPAVGVARNVPRKRVMEMLLTGELIDAPTALAWGLVNRVVPAEELDAAVARYTDGIRAKSRTVVALGKRAFYRQVEHGLADAYAACGEVMAGNLLLPDAAEGIDAFLGKRPPDWGAAPGS